MKEPNIIFGIHPVLEAIASGKEIEKVLIKKAGSGTHLEDLLNTLRTNGIPFQFVPVEKLNRISPRNHQGVIAYFSEFTYAHIEEVLPEIIKEGKVPFILAIDQVTDVRNFGAICRSAECAGIHAILIADKGSAGVNADAMKTSAGALNHIRVCRAPVLRNALKYLQNSGLKLVAASEKSEKLYHDVDYKGPVALIMGAEDTGIHRDILRITDEVVRIPMQGHTESLNVSVAAGVMLFEVVRQRGSM
jgi:23S rRNA (guanosine2251-2'-O)-methyltransferase